MLPTIPCKLARIAGPSFGLAAALAASAVLAGPPSDAYLDDLRFFDRGDSLSADASVFNLSSKRDVFVSLIATARLDVVCINPGGNLVPSQTPEDLELDVSGDAYYPRYAIEFGRLDIDVETDDIDDEIPGAPDCPNKNWTERVTRVRFSQAQLIVRQSNVRSIDLFCVFKPPTKNGKVPGNRVDCFSF